MNITKDEARILAQCVEIAKFEFNQLPPGGFDKLTGLEKKLENFGKDKRREGRTSLDNFSDVMKRFTKK